MPKVTRADWAAQVPANGIVGVIPAANIPAGIGVTDIGQLKAAGFPKGSVPQWNGSRFVAADQPSSSSSTSNETGIIPVNSPGVATRRQPPGLPYGPTQDVWMQEIFDVRQYGAVGSGAHDDLGAFNAAIAALNAAGGGCLKLPAGNYVLSASPETFAVPASVIGDGCGVSTVTCDASGFSGGSGGSWFEVAELSLLSNGTSGTGISLTNGTSAGDAFSFHDLEIEGFYEAVGVNAVARSGWLANCLLRPLATGLNASCNGIIGANLIFTNAGSNAAVAMVLNGNQHQFHGVRILAGTNSWAYAVTVATGSEITLADMLVYGTVNAAIDLTTSGSVRVQNLSFGNVQGSQPVVYNALLHYVNELYGLGGNANSDYDLRKELSASVTWNPASLRPLESTTNDVTVTGARAGDQVVVGTPDATDFWQVSGRVVANDTVRITLTNVSINVVDLPSAVYKVRVFN